MSTLRLLVPICASLFLGSYFVLMIISGATATLFEVLTASMCFS